VSETIRTLRRRMLFAHFAKLGTLATHMSTLSSSSTLTQIKNAYLDNASYAEDASVTKARAFITACRILLLRLPKRAAHGRGNEVEMDPRLIAEEMRSAQRWLVSSSDNAIKHLSLEEFRD
jgi:hypothetical protein